MTWVRVDLLGFLFGDVLAINQFDLLIGLGGAVVLLILRIIWRPLFATQWSRDARLRVSASRRIDIMILVASVIAISMKLLECYSSRLLIIPAASAVFF